MNGRVSPISLLHVTVSWRPCLKKVRCQRSPMIQGVSAPPQHPQGISQTK
ncbi:hypothetical protein FKM82_022802 [Ascaphus truei]